MTIARSKISDIVHDLDQIRIGPVLKAVFAVTKLPGRVASAHPERAVVLNYRGVIVSCADLADPALGTRIRRDQRQNHHCRHDQNHADSFLHFHIPHPCFLSIALSTAIASPAIRNDIQA